MCIYIYISLYIYKHTYVYTHIHTYIRTQANSNLASEIRGSSLVPPTTADAARCSARSPPRLGRCSAAPCYVYISLSLYIYIYRCIHIYIYIYNTLYQIILYYIVLHCITVIYIYVTHYLARWTATCRRPTELDLIMIISDIIMITDIIVIIIIVITITIIIISIIIMIVITIIIVSIIVMFIISVIIIIIIIIGTRHTEQGWRGEAVSASLRSGAEQLCLEHPPDILQTLDAKLQNPSSNSCQPSALFSQKLMTGIWACQSSSNAHAIRFHNAQIANKARPYQPTRPTLHSNPRKTGQARREQGNGKRLDNNDDNESNTIYIYIYNYISLYASIGKLPARWSRRPDCLGCAARLKGAFCLLVSCVSHCESG